MARCHRNQIYPPTRRSARLAGLAPTIPSTTPAPPATSASTVTSTDPTCPRFPNGIPIGPLKTFSLFLDLPPEIRNTAYEFYLANLPKNPDTIHLDAKGDFVPPALARVSTQLRKEFLSLWTDETKRKGLFDLDKPHNRRITALVAVVENCDFHPLMQYLEHANRQAEPYGAMFDDACITLHFSATYSSALDSPARAGLQAWADLLSSENGRRMNEPWTNALGCNSLGYKAEFDWDALRVKDAWLPLVFVPVQGETLRLFPILELEGKAVEHARAARCRVLGRKPRDVVDPWWDEEAEKRPGEQMKAGVDDHANHYYADDGDPDDYQADEHEADHDGLDGDETDADEDAEQDKNEDEDDGDDESNATPANTTDPSTPSTFHRFMDLPAELRLAIYHHCIPNETIRTLYLIDNELDCPAPALAQSCKDVWRAYFPLWQKAKADGIANGGFFDLSTNTFVTSLRAVVVDLDFEGLRDYLESAQRERSMHSRYVFEDVSIELVFTAAYHADAAQKGLEEWAEWLHIEIDSHGANWRYILSENEITFTAKFDWSHWAVEDAWLPLVMRENDPMNLDFILDEEREAVQVAREARCEVLGVDAGELEDPYDVWLEEFYEEYGDQQ